MSLEEAVRKVRVARQQKWRFANPFDNIYFEIRDSKQDYLTYSLPLRRKSDVTKKLFQLWKEADEGAGLKWIDEEGYPVYSVAIYDGDPDGYNFFVGEIGSLLWAQLVSTMGNRNREKSLWEKEAETLLKTT